jgi:hypothetical protein
MEWLVFGEEGKGVPRENQSQFYLHEFSSTPIRAAWLPIISKRYRRFTLADLIKW